MFCIGVGEFCIFEEGRESVEEVFEMEEFV